MCRSNDLVLDPFCGCGTTIAAAERLKLQFQWWALKLVRAKPIGDKKKGADKGSDGVIHFIDDASGKLKTVVIQVKSGRVESGDVRDLKGVMQRDKAEMGLFISLEEPTSAMRVEALQAGYYHSEGWGHDYPACQIVTIEMLLEGYKSNLPPENQTFKQAPKAIAETGEALQLDVG